MTDDCGDIEEHELPVVETVLAGTLALMTGYSQALQAELYPQQRLLMGEKIGRNLALLVDHPQLSCGFRDVLHGLKARWQAMSACTREAALDCTTTDGLHPPCTPDPYIGGPQSGGKHLH